MFTKTTTPDWLADLFESAEAELATRAEFHVPANISQVDDVRYAICVNCDQNVESWYDDSHEDRLPSWGAYGVRVELLNNCSTLNKVCRP